MKIYLVCDTRLVIWRSNMSLGLCCQWIEPKTKRDGSIVYENIINECGLQLGQFKQKKYSQIKILEIYRNNVDEIIKLIPKLLKNNIKCFRLSSSLLPLFEFNSEMAKNDQILLDKFAMLGKLFVTNNIRVTCHPGQFVVLSSDKEEVIKNSILDLSYHAWMFDCMGLSQTPYNAINIHGGKANQSKRLKNTIDKLPLNIKSRLTLENDELCYSVKELLDISNSSGIPIVFDSHHHFLNQNGLDIDSAFIKTLETWEKVGHKPLQHISNSVPGNEFKNIREKRKHSDYIQTIPICQLNAVKSNLIDLEIEAKMKNLAIFKLCKDFNL